MSTDLVRDYIEQLKRVDKALREYQRAKLLYKELESDLLINTDWDKINEERASKDLPKISNEKTRTAYLLIEGGLLHYKENVYDTEKLYKFEEGLLNARKYSIELRKQINTIP